MIFEFVIPKLDAVSACCAFFTFFFNFTMPREAHLTLPHKGAMVELRKSGVQRRERATSIEGLKRIAWRVWQAITPQYFQTLYKLMPRRMQAVIDIEGGHTKY